METAQIPSAEISNKDNQVVIPTKKEKKFPVIFILTALLAILFAVTYLLVMTSSTRGKNPMTKDDSAVVPETQFKNFAYLTIDESKKTNLVIYNTITQEKLTDFPEFSIKGEVFLSIGKWSPTGQFLPVIVSSAINESYQDGESFFFFYDSQTKKLRQIFHESNKTLDFRWQDNGFLEMSGNWLTDSDFLIDMQSVEGKDYKELELMYVTVEGESKTKIVTADTSSENGEGIQVRYISDSLVYKSKGTLTGSTTYFATNYLGKDYKLPLKLYPPAGVIEGNLVTHYQPLGLSLLTDSDAFKALEGLPQKEQEIKTLELLKPTGKDKLIFSNSAGEQVREIPLVFTDWNIDDVMVLEDSKQVLVHQSEHEISPRKERYLKVQLDGTYEVIYERTVPDAVREMFLTRNYLELTPDKKALILFDVSSANSVSSVDISTKEVTNICVNCAMFRVNNPWRVRSVF